MLQSSNKSNIQGPAQITNMPAPTVNMQPTANVSLRPVSTSNRILFKPRITLPGQASQVQAQPIARCPTGCTGLATDILVTVNSCPFSRPIWNGIDNIREDRCAQSIEEYESRGPGCYETNNFYRWSTTPAEYSCFMTEPGHMQKVYGDACSIDAESDLKFAPLTNMRDIQQLYTPPYQTVPYMGAGAATFRVDLESELQQGQVTTYFNACDSTSQVTLDRFECLPAYGNPARLDHIIFQSPTGNIQGIPTRDLVRSVNYNKYCQNQINNSLFGTRPLPNPTVFNL